MCLILLLILMFVNLVILNVFLFQTLKFTAHDADKSDNGLYRTVVSPDGKQIGSPLNISEIATRQVCNMALISFNFFSLGYTIPCCFDLGVQSVFVRNACLMSALTDSTSITSDFTKTKKWNVCEWEGVKCLDLEIVKL